MTQQTNQDQLRQLSNSVEVIGKLKSKELEIKTSKNGNEYITGKLVVLSKIDDKLNETAIKIFIMKSSKLFKGIETVKNEYKAMDDVGEENSDRIKVTGELKLNEYYNSNGTLVQFNEVKGVFFNRLDTTNDQPDKALASIDVVIDSFEQKMDKDNLPTGDYSVNAFTVGFGNEVIELKNAIVKSDLAQAFMGLYQPGQTGRLTFKLNNYVEIEEKVEEVSAPTHGFGSTETVETNSVIKNYVNNLEIIGGDVPYFGSKEYSQEEIQKAKQIRNLKLTTLQQPAPAVPQTNTGFGGVPNTAPTQSIPQQNQIPPFSIGSDGMPDF